MLKLRYNEPIEIEDDGRKEVRISRLTTIEDAQVGDVTRVMETYLGEGFELDVVIKVKEPK